MRTTAGVPGLEPRLAEPESAVLPITPYPKNPRNRWSEHLYRLSGTRGPSCSTKISPADSRFIPVVGVPLALSAAPLARMSRALSRRRLRSRPSSSSDSNSGGLTVEPVAATRIGPNALRGLSPSLRPGPPSVPSRFRQSTTRARRRAPSAQRRELPRCPPEFLGSCLLIDRVGVIVEELQQLPGIAQNHDACLHQARQPLRTAGRPGERRDPGLRSRREPGDKLILGEKPDVLGVDRVCLRWSNRAGLALTSTTSNAATISSRVNTSRSPAIDQPSSAR